MANIFSPWKFNPHFGRLSDDMTEIILGSQSPRRREILHYFSIPFRQMTPPFDESQVLFQGYPAQFVIEVARRKALCLSEKHPHIPILTADTTVCKDGQLFQKPESLEEAHAMLRELAGKKHEVHTGVCVALGDAFYVDSEKSTVEFHSLTDDQIRAYHKTISPLDKAGAYAIQKTGSLIVKRIEGCYYNIMGLPLHAMHRLLLKVGIDLWEYLKPL